MIDYLIEQLGKDYKVIITDKNKREIEVYKRIKEEIDLETYLTLTNSNNKWSLYKVQRNKYFLKAEFTNFDFSIYALYMMAVSMFEADNGNVIARTKLRDAGSDMKKAEKILNEYVQKQYFSLFTELKGAINIEAVSTNYDVYYLTTTNNRVNIVSNRKAPIIYVVIYNFATKLEKFDVISGVWDKKTKIDTDNRENIKRLFLGK